MCNFKSGVVLPDLTVLMNDWTDNHSDLIELHGLRDDKPEPSFVKVEYSPSNNEYWNIDTYVLNVDQDRVPEWWNDEARARVGRIMQRRVQKMIITENRKLLVGGQYIIHDCKVSEIKNANIISISGSARIDHVSGSARIDDVYDSVRIDDVYGSASIGEVSDSASIGRVSDSARIDDVYGSASIGEVSDSASIGRVSDSARIDRVYDSASIGHVFNSARIDYVYDSVSIGRVSGSATIINDHR